MQYFKNNQKTVSNILNKRNLIVKYDFDNFQSKVIEFQINYNYSFFIVIINNFLLNSKHINLFTFDHQVLARFRHRGCFSCELCC